MPLLRTITNAAWPTSGAASAANSGFSSLSTSQYEVDENGETYITTAAGNTGLTVRIDPTASVFASGETRYHCEIVIYAEFTSTSDTNSLGAPSGFCLYLNDGVTSELNTMTLAAVNTTYVTGFAATFSSSRAGDAGKGQTCSGVAVGPTGTTASKECIPVNRKFTFGIFADRTGGTSGGFGGVTINGVRIGGWLTAQTTSFGTDFSYQLPATPGVRWRIYASSTRPARSWSGSDHEFSADYTNNPMTTEDGLQYSLPHISLHGSHGDFWSYSGNFSLTEYATSGGNPNRKRLIGGSGGVTATSKFDLGNLSFNRYGDYGMVTTFYVPSGGTWSLTLRNAANSADVLKVQVSGGQLLDGSGAVLSARDGVTPSVSTTERYALRLTLNRDGTARWYLETNSSDALSRRSWSNTFNSGWVSQAIGKIILTCSNTVEGDRVDMGPWMTLALVDSLSTAFETAVTPYLAHTANNLAYGFPHSDGIAVPGIEYHGQRWGWPRESWMAPGGRSGRKHAEWITYVRENMTDVGALRLVLLDGGCWNDIATGGATATTLLGYVQTDLAWCDQHNCELYIMPSFDRPLGLAQSATPAQRKTRLEYNAQLEAWARTNSSNPRLYYLDHTKSFRDIMRSTDGVHPSNGVADQCRGIQSQRETATQVFRGGYPLRAKRRAVIVGGRRR
jgi:hypothetical protein